MQELSLTPRVSNSPRCLFGPARWVCTPRSSRPPSHLVLGGTAFARSVQLVSDSRFHPAALLAPCPISGRPRWDYLLSGSLFPALSSPCSVLANGPEGETGQRGVVAAQGEGGERQAATLLCHRWHQDVAVSPHTIMKWKQGGAPPNPDVHWVPRAKRCGQRSPR